MPTCRRKRVVLTEPSEHLLQVAKTDPNKEVYYMQQTGEIFETYEAYAARMSFYRLRQFQCEVTGKSGLDYFQAIESEQQEARTMHSRFPEQLKSAVLKAVQWQVMGRLDHLVEAVYDRFKDRYFEDEKVFVDVQGDKFWAKVVQVFPPKPTVDADTSETPGASTSKLPSTSTTPTPDVAMSLASDEEAQPIHQLTGDLKVSAKEVNTKDDPTKYLYKIQILEEQNEKSHEKSKTTAKDRAKWNGSLMEVQCTVMSRDRLAFSKSILRRFVRDCVDRDPAVASPWTVKPAIAKKYGVDSDMPESTRKGVEDIKKGEIDKRKKAWEDKEGPPNKKQKKMTPAQEEKARLLAIANEKKEREVREKAEKSIKAKEEAERLAAEKKKKKPIRYPTEDLDVRLADKERKAGVKVKRPVPSRVALPFSEVAGVNFEAFLMSWNFLVVYGTPLHLSSFTLDEFEHAIRHSDIDLPCQLLAEIHSTLIYNLRTVPFVRHSAVLSLLQMSNQIDIENEDDNVLGVSTPELTTAMAEVGNNWERVPLRHAEGREGWEDALVGCLKDHANVENFPNLRVILTRLLFAPETSEGTSVSSSNSRQPTPTAPALTIGSSPGERYYTLPYADKISILAFMCNLAVSSKAIHTHMETCEEQLTALRKEKIEVNRQKKQYTEEMNTLLGEAEAGKVAKEEAEPPIEIIAEDEDMMQDSSDLSDVPSDAGEEGSESGSATPSATSGVRPKSSSRQKDLRQKAHNQAHAKQREAARAKATSAKQAMADHRKLDEEVNKLERRLEGIERDFRKLLGSVRVKAMGRDRFYNRIWWFDGMGSASLLGSGGVVQYGTGRLFVQGPSEFDVEMLQRREPGEVEERRREEEGEEGILAVGEWAVYTDLEELDEFLQWLNPKGHRELALKNALTKWWPHIVPGVRKRIADLNTNAKLPEARRSARMKNGHDISRDPYMLWQNRRANTTT